MAVESWLASTFSYSEAVVIDSAELQTAIEAELTGAGWTETSANVWKSPDTTRWIQLTFSQPAATKLQIALVDYLARAPAAAKRVGAIGNPSTWQIHANRYGLVLWNSSAAGFFFSGVVDHFPKAYTSHNFDVYFGGYHTTADAVSSDTADTYAMVGYAGFDTSYGRTQTGKNPTYPMTKSVTGVRRDIPNYAFTPIDASHNHLAGRWHHVIIVDGNLAKDIETPVPIDVDVSAIFKVTGIVGSIGSVPRKLAVRIS